MANHFPNTPAHAEDGHLEPTTDFDYDEIDRSLGHTKDLETLSDADIDAAAKVITRVFEFVWQNGMKNPEGLQIRATIVCWVFLKHLHPLTLTELARGFGKKKQSLGRWVDEWKRHPLLGKLRNPHMKAGDKNVADPK